MGKIQNLIFDMGEVLIGYRWKEMLTVEHGLTFERAQQVAQAAFDDKNWLELDAGNMSVDEFLEDSRRRKPEIADDLRHFLKNCKSMRVLRPKVYEILSELKKKGYRCYILSNYSRELFYVHTHDLPIWKDIDGVVVSYEVHYLKPQKEIYQSLLEKYQLEPEQCLFFDDRLENVQGARKVGMKSIQVLSERQLILELTKLRRNRKCF